MAKLVNDEGTVKLNIRFLGNRSNSEYNSDSFDLISYYLSFEYGEDRIEYTENKTISRGTLQYLIHNLNNIIETKSRGKEFEDIFEVNPIDNSFFMKIEERGIENLVYVEMWFNIGVLTKGEVIGFSKGIKFDCTINSLQTFCNEIQNEYFNITNTKL